MGIELQARSSLKKKGLIFSSTITIEQVAAALMAAAKGTPLEATTASRRLEDGVSITFHPGGAPVDVRADREDVVIDVKTSLLGPGYHAFVVSALESAGSALGLRWQWDDEAGYVEDRDFAKLQACMTKLVKELAAAMRAHVGSDEELAGTRIFMDPDFRVETYDNEVLTPLRPVSVDRFVSWQTLDDADLQTEATHFVYSWWGEGFDPWFFRGLALYSMWNDIRWAYPIDPKEVELAKRTLGWVKEAMKIGIIGEEFFPPVIEEISAVILAKEGPLHFPNAEGIGYRRRRMQLGLGRNWTVTIPASLGRRIEESDGQVSLVIENHVLDIRVTLGTAAAREDLDPDDIDIVQRLIKETDGLLVQHVIARTFQGGGRDAICELTLTLRDPRFKDLVQEIIDSVGFAETDPEEVD